MRSRPASALGQALMAGCGPCPFETLSLADPLADEASEESTVVGLFAMDDAGNVYQLTK